MSPLISSISVAPARSSNTASCVGPMCRSWRIVRSPRALTVRLRGGLADFSEFVECRGCPQMTIGVGAEFVVSASLLELNVVEDGVRTNIYQAPGQ